MSKRLTLAEQLAQISEPAPQDFDPEDSYATYNAEKSDAQRDLDAARADYVDVGPSGLRKRNHAVVDSMYAGKTGSRSNLYGDDEGQESEDDDEEEEYGNIDGLDGGQEEEDEEEEEMGDFEDLEDDHEESDAGVDDDDDDDDDDDNASQDEDEPSQEKAPSLVRQPAPRREEGEKAMLKQLRQAASADVDKGRDVKKQLAFCDNVLESRIKVQKAAVAANSLPQPHNAYTYFSELPNELADTLAELEALNEELFELRQSMMAANEQLQLPAGLGNERKRKRGLESSGEYLSTTIADLAVLEDVFNPFLRSTVTKWSDKVLAASGLALGSNKKFKAVNQNVMSQIDHALSATERDRLLKRTRVRRSTDRPIIGKVELAELEGEKKVGDDEVFDDGDFYQQLLRDVIEGRMLDLDDPTLESLRNATARNRKQKKVVDTRASKGRKIRYHVHEKAQNFMIPVEAGNWHEEQIDELFASLLGRTFVPAAGRTDVERDDVAADGASGPTAQNVDVGSLRLFG